MNDLLSSAYEKFARFVFSYYCPMRVFGRENLPPAPYILCSNHCSHLDTPVLMLSVGLPFSRFGMIAAKDYFFSQKSKKLPLKIMNLIPLDRAANRQSIELNIELCRAYCQRGQILIFYPEGTRSISGKMQKFKKGAAQYASELGVPIVPVHIQGTFRSLRKGRSVPLPAKIRVNIGKPLFVKESRLPALREATQELEARIESLKGGGIG